MEMLELRQNGLDGGCLFAGCRKTVEGVKMKTKAIQIVAITVAANQAHSGCALQTAVCYAKSKRRSAAEFHRRNAG